MHAMKKNRQRADDSNWIPEVVPWRVVILAKLAKFGKNGEKSPRPLESGTNGEKSPEDSQRPECGKYSN